MTATCERCGPVSVYKNDKKSKHYRCGKGRKSKHHGLTGIEEEELKKSATCAICGSTERLVIDHNHATNEVRGVLCTFCNIGLGHFRDDPDRLRLAAKYIEADGRLSLSIERHEMGKKREAYQKAQQALGMARSRASDVEGGSTSDAYEQAHTDLKQAVRNENDTWQQFIEDPQG